MSLKKTNRTKSLSLSDDFPTKASSTTGTTAQRCLSVDTGTAITSKILASSSSATTATPSSSTTSTPRTSSTAFGAFVPRLNTIGRHNFANKRIEDTAKIFKYIDDNVIGKGVAFLGPFGRRKVVYADYSSSGRSLQFLEDYINKEVLPAYGDSNCTSSVTGLQSQLYYNEAKDLIRAAVNASADDEIIFCETAASSPVERVAYLLCLKDNGCGGGFNGSNIQDNNGTQQQQSLPPVLFVSTSETEKNLQPWLELGVQIERISKTREGYLDLVILEKKLGNYRDSERQLIGLFSGASRLSGILADDMATTILLHQYGALSIWDYSPAAPCTTIDANPTLPGATKDAIFFCANKFIGGVQAPGVLIIKKSLLNNGNGNNNQINHYLVHKHHHHHHHHLHHLNHNNYHQNHQQLHEQQSSTICDSVGIVGAVRAGLVVQLKESLGTHNIMNRHEKLCKQMLSHIRTIPEIILLGPLVSTAKRTPTMCFLLRHPRGTYLHHRFVVAVLNDVFGIQATAHNAIVEAMGISKKMTIDYERILSDETLRLACLQPGYTRITLPFFMGDAEVAFILEALKMVATEAWKLLPQYEVDRNTGEWKHQSNSLLKERKWLSTIRYTDGRMLFNDRRVSGPGAFPQNYADCLQTARNLFNRSRKLAQRNTTSTNGVLLRLKRDDAESLRWYILPGEAHELLLGHSQNIKHTVPFDPNKILDPPSLMTMMFRHNSLSALDVKRFKCHSVPTSPDHIPIQRQQSNPSPTLQKQQQQQQQQQQQEEEDEEHQQQNVQPTTIPERKESFISPLPILSTVTGIPKFSLGGEVTRNIATSTLVSQAINVPDRSFISKRNRCHSWSSTRGINSLSPQTRINLGLSPPIPLRLPREHLCSCSSQTDLEELTNCCSIEQSIGTMVVDVVHPSTTSISSESDDIEAYVTGITTDIATELKSGIREVISQVEDVLDQTDSSENLSSLNLLSLNNLSSAEEMRNDSVSATDVAEYLKEFSKGITDQVTSEIREIVNVMNENNNNNQNINLNDQQQDQFVRRSSTTPPPPPSSSKPDIFDQSFLNSTTNENKIQHHRFSDQQELSLTMPKKGDCDNKQRSESFPNPSISTIPQLQPKYSTSASSPESSTPTCPYTGTISKLTNSFGTASHDSGINMYDPDDITINTSGNSITSINNYRSRISSSSSSSAVTPIVATATTITSSPIVSANVENVDSPQHDGLMMRSLSQQSHSDNCLNNNNNNNNNTNKLITTTTTACNNCSSPSTLTQPQQQLRSNSLIGHELCDLSISMEKIFKRDNSIDLVANNEQINCLLSSNSIGIGVGGAGGASGSTTTAESLLHQWHYLPGHVWKQTAEAIDEFGMVKDGDRILICLSGSSSSLCLLHALRQFSRARGIHIEMAAVSLGKPSGVDPRALMLYLRDLNVKYIFEQIAPTEGLRSKLYQVARQNGYNVIALGNSLDKLAEDFLMSLLNKGRLQATQAHCWNRDGDVRVIRPFIYVREKQLEDFAIQKDLPTRPSKLFTKPLDASNSMLKVQETINPNVYDNIKLALRPMLSLRIEASKSSYEYYKSMDITRE